MEKKNVMQFVEIKLSHEQQLQKLPFVLFCHSYKFDLFISSSWTINFIQHLITANKQEKNDKGNDKNTWKRIEKDPQSCRAHSSHQKA